VPKRLYGGHSDAKGRYFAAHPSIVLRRKLERMEKRLRLLRKRYPDSKYEIQRVEGPKGNKLSIIKLTSGKKYKKRKEEKNGPK